MIQDEIDSYDGQWRRVKENLNNLSNEASKRYVELEPLIRYFEHQMLIASFSNYPQLAQTFRHISDDIASLEKTSSDYRPIFEDVESLVTSGDLLTIISKIEDYEKLTQVLQSLFYLASLSEDTILDTYFPAVLSDNTTPFVHFTQDHRDAYTRLKFRALNRKVDEHKNCERHIMHKVDPSKLDDNSSQIMAVISSLEQKMTIFASRLSSSDQQMKLLSTSISPKHLGLENQSSLD